MRSQEFRLVVSKVVLDMLSSGKMNIQGIFSEMKHRYTKPGTYLLSSPYRVEGSGRGTKYLPQLPAAIRVGYHTATCGVRATTSLVNRDIDQRTRDGERFPWAADALIENCTCWRSRKLSQSSGVSMPEQTRKGLELKLGGAAAMEECGLESQRTASTDSTYEDMNWVEHVKRLHMRSPYAGVSPTGQPVEAMTQDELRAAGLDKAHPSYPGWVRNDAPRGGAHIYPFCDAASFVAAHAAESQRRGAGPRNVDMSDTGPQWFGDDA